MKLSLLSPILAKFQFCWFLDLFWAFFPCKKYKKWNRRRTAEGVLKSKNWRTQIRQILPGSTASLLEPLARRRITSTPWSITWPFKGSDMLAHKWEGEARSEQRRPRLPWPPPFFGRTCLCVLCVAKQGFSWVDSRWSAQVEPLLPWGETMRSDLREVGQTKEGLMRSVSCKEGRS